MTFYAEMAALATEMLAPEADGGFGKSVAYIRAKTAPTYNTTTGAVAETETDTAVNAIQTEYNQYHDTGAQIEQGDLFFVLDALPTIKDELYISGLAYDIVQVWDKTPGDTFVACRVQTRIGV